MLRRLGPQHLMHWLQVDLSTLPTVNSAISMIRASTITGSSFSRLEKAGERITITRNENDWDDSGLSRALDHQQILHHAREIGGFVESAEGIVDHSPPPAPREHVVPLFTRDRASGRPTKRERRQLDRFRQR